MNGEFMKFKKVNENKIIIMLSGAELASRNIDISNIKDNSIAYQKLFWDMMERAQTELDFDVTGSQLMVETAPDRNGNIIITITKSGGGKAPAGAIEKLVSEILGNAIEEIAAQSGNEEDTAFTHECIGFQNIEDVIEFCKSLRGIHSISSALFDFEDRYYLVLRRTKRNNKAVSNLLEAALEFNGLASDSYLLHSMLEERGNKIIKARAIKTLAESFG